FIAAPEARSTIALTSRSPSRLNAIRYRSSPPSIWAGRRCRVTSRISLRRSTTSGRSRREKARNQRSRSVPNRIRPCCQLALPTSPRRRTVHSKAPRLLETSTWRVTSRSTTTRATKSIPIPPRRIGMLRSLIPCAVSSEAGGGGLGDHGVVDTDGHDVRVDGDETALDVQRLDVAVLVDDPHRTGAEDRQGGLHLRQDAHRAVDRRHDDLRGLPGPDGAVRGDEGDLERTHAPSSWSMRCWFSSTMSMPPTLKNACSVMWSNSPSQMPLKPSMVSFSGTSEPSTPVNCFARWVFCERNCWIRRARETVTLSSSESSSTPSIAMMSCSSLLRWRICFTRTAVS